ncbi:DUF3376 domain-containing protein [Mycolicibacterium litorale]|uniref:PNPLA domain-containing protein n=1 Tax=Mycolicibacterium litorale TaxID=758802 RepID=A0AAD1INJ4_9MYCO|nr:DUF3376 domain-containing protein [Mycolicibacterium litorale]TDY09810.1 patatin-related protein [Mycolicibacterium litorale]BBY17768.1 hypothetical protein MLIT_33600 [Mycolicibacterium litorale]
MSANTQQEQSTGTTPRRTLRLALAMRGGVSLAVWIGGAVAEIDVFRRACSGGPTPAPGSRGARYREMLHRTGKYGSVEIDILAGASAGGLNAVLYGLAQTCGSRLDDIAHSTWIQDGGMWELLREPGLGRVPSVLRGDEHFYVVMREALKRIADKSEGAYAVQRLTVELAATLLTDESDSDRANRARFSFLTSQGTMGSRQSTIPNGAEAGTPDGESALDRLALAARATSSFPGAFEPASIYSVTPAAPDAQSESPSIPPYFEPRKRGDLARGTRRESRPGGRDAGLGVNMSAAFPYAEWYSLTAERDSEEAVVESPYNVVDGGLFDNIPIDRAIRAIKLAPASGPSERFLLYLDPEPPARESTEIDATRKDSALNWLPVIKRSLSLKQRAETAQDELGLLLEHNDAVLANRGRLEALASRLRANSPGAPPFIDPQAYVQYRIAADSARIASLLTNPWEELCQPPRLGGDYIPLNRQLALTVKDQLAASYNGTTGIEARLASDVVAMAAQVRVLIAWARSLESLLQELADYPDPQGERALAGATISAWKLTLYRWLSVLVAAKHRAVDEVLVDPLRSDRERFETYPLADRMDECFNAQDDLLLTDELAEMLCAPSSPADDIQFHRYLADGDEFTTGTPLAENLTSAVATARACLLNDSSPVVAGLPTLQPPVPDKVRIFTESVYALFYDAPLDDASVADITMLFCQTGIPDTASIVKFDRITSTEPASTEVVDTGVLVRAARATLLRSWLRRPPTDVVRLQQVLDMDPRELVSSSDAKLAGNALARFGGFLLTNWRRNDWQWGRLDAAAALTRIIDDSYPTPPEDENAREAQRDNDIEFLQGSICADARTAGDTTADGRLVTETVGGQTLDALTPHYRFALASRIVPLLSRAVLPADSAGWPAKAAQWAAHLALLRPLAVPLPLVADPLRLVLALAAILLSSALLGVSDSPRPLHIVYILVLIGLGGAIGVATARIHSRWRTMRKTFPPEDDSRQAWRDLLAASDRGRYRAASGLLALMVVAVGVWHLVDLVRHWDSGRSSDPGYLAVPFEAFAALVTLAVAAYRWLFKKSAEIEVEGIRAVGAKHGVRRFVGVLSALALIAVVLSTPDVPKAWRPEWLTPTQAAAVIAGVTVAVLVGVSLWGWAAGRGLAICVVAITLAAALLQYVFDVWWKSSGNRVLDILPVLTWMVLLGNVIAVLPCRRANYGDPAAVSVSRERPSGTSTTAPAGAPSSSTAVPGGSDASRTRTG